MPNLPEPFAASPYLKGSHTERSRPSTPTSPMGHQISVDRVPSTGSSSSFILIEQQKYGTGKPRRVITRGQVVHAGK
jgi:hypothetical protein